MGCDIHLYVEKKVDGKWVSADKWTKDKYSDDPKKVSVGYKDSFYSGRNYDLFAILADVRNGRGFAGCKTGEGFNTIKKPRGIPKDCDPRVKAEADGWDCDGHSHSFLTVAELIAFDWTQQTKKSGWVNGPAWEEWQRKKEWNPGPNSYCGMVSGGGVKHVSADEMTNAIAEVIKSCGGDWRNAEKAIAEKLGDTYAEAVWGEDYASLCSEFWINTLPKLLALGKPQDVRIVFWFDN